VDTAALKASWARVAGLGGQAAEVFYAVLFTAAPKLRGMFPVSMTAQRDRLLHALGHIVSHVDDPHTLASFAAQLGRDHRKYGVLAEHYPLVGQALLETLRRGLGAAWTPDLARDWAAAYHHVATLMCEAAEQAAGRTPAWWQAEILQVDRRAPDVTVLSVRPDYPYEYLPGQSVPVETEHRPRVWRYLSPANAPRADGTIEFHVRAVPGGALSPVLVYQLRAGDTVKLGAPLGEALTGYRTTGRDLLLIAGGTGLAPMRAIIDDLTAGGGAGRLVTLVVGAHTAMGLYDRRVLHHRAATTRWLRLVEAVQQGPLYGANRGTAVEVALATGSWPHAEVYLCGSPTMVAATHRQLQAAGHDPGRLHSETYSYHAYPPLTRQPARR
jgi:NAD(P)H-flavin reductase/hemoglobin-like flavoprotein